MLVHGYEGKFMQIAFNLAKKHRGLTFPNPSVGCVIVRDGKIISSGTTEVRGRPHAEKVAILNAKDTAGADLFVTLEPCSHFGETPPCVFAIVEAKIKRVFIGMQDPDKRVNGSGIEFLKQNGVEVASGIMQDELMEFYKPYLKVKSTGIPFVSAKIICSLDGKVATNLGKSKWISTSKARDFTNYIRHFYDGILVGTNTYNQDAPSLTCRTEGLLGFSPKKFLLSNTLKSAKDFEVLNGNLIDFLPRLYQDFKIQNLLIEGGAGVITSALKEDVVDEILIGFSPFFIGEDGKNCNTFKDLKELYEAKHFLIKNHFEFDGMIFIQLSNV